MAAKITIWRLASQMKNHSINLRYGSFYFHLVAELLKTPFFKTWLLWIVLENDIPEPYVWSCSDFRDLDLGQALTVLKLSGMRFCRFLPEFRFFEGARGHFRESSRFVEKIWGGLRSEFCLQSSVVESGVHGQRFGGPILFLFDSFSRQDHCL